MEEKGDKEREPTEPSRPLFVEVTCKSSGKVRRFAAGTEASFALDLINRKLRIRVPAASHIEAIKEGEEPVSFGPNSILVNYGSDWKLQTVTEEGYEESKQLQQISKPLSSIQKSVDFHPARKPVRGSSSGISLHYFGKLMVAFAFIFLLGGTLTLLLENLPRLILFVNSSY